MRTCKLIILAAPLYSLFLHPKIIPVHGNQYRHHLTKEIVTLCRNVHSYLSLLLRTIQKQGLTRTKMNMLVSWLENQSKSNLRTLLNCRGVHLSWDGEKWFWTPCVLDESTYLAIVVHPSLYTCQWVQSMLCSNSERVFVAWEAMTHLCTNSCVGQRAYRVEVGSGEGVTFVIPVSSQTEQLSHQ